MAVYPHEQDEAWMRLVDEFKKANGREPNDLDKLTLTQLWSGGYEPSTGPDLHLVK